MRKSGFFSILAVALTFGISARADLSGANPCTPADGYGAFNGVANNLLPAAQAIDKLEGREAAPESVTAPSSDGQDSVIVLSDAQLKCLKSSPPQTCFAQLQVPSPDGPPRGPAAFVTGTTGGTGGRKSPSRMSGSAGDPLTDHLDRLREDYLKSKIQVDPNLISKSYGNINVGVHVGGYRYFADQIDGDPDMKYTEDNAKNSGVWVRHELEIRPELNPGESPGKILNSRTTASAGGSISGAYSKLIYVVKRHDVKDYGDSFWGYGKQDGKLIEQSFPMYYHLPSDIKHDNFLPGEGVEVETFGTVSYFVGSNVAAAVANPAAFLGIGGVAQIGFSDSHTIDHYKTILEVKQNHLARLVLENLKDHQYGIDAQVNANFKVGPINKIGATVAEAGYLKDKSSAHVLDLVIDTNNPKAAEAISRAYRGDFRLAQSIAQNAQTMFAAGATEARHVDITSKGHSAFYSLLVWSGSHREMIDDEVAHGIDAKGQMYDTHEEGDTLDTKTDGFHQNYHLAVVERFNRQAVDPAVARTMDVEINDDDSKTSNARSLEFLRVAKTFAPADKVPEIDQWISALNADKTKTRLRFNFDFTPQSVSALLKMGAGPALAAQYWEAWARVMELPDAAKWGGYTEVQREVAMYHVSKDLKDHYQAARKFRDNMVKALKDPDVGKQAHDFIEAIYSLGDEIYPLGVLVMMANPDSILGTMHLTSKVHGNVKTIDVLNVGKHYTRPDPNYSLIY